MEMLAISLSKVTTRGVDITWASSDAFIKDITALAPSAFRKPVPHPNPFWAVFPSIPGVPSIPLAMPGVGGVVTMAPPGPTVDVPAAGGIKNVELLPNDTFCADK